MKRLITACTTIILLFSLNQPVFSAEAVDFNLPTVDGKIELTQLKGSVVYVDFWASWCTPCRKSFPWMNRMHVKYEEQGLKIIGISLDSTKESANRFLKKVPALFTIVYDMEGNTADAYNVQVMPTSYLIDKKGNIVYTHKGFNKKYENKMENEIIKALAN